MVLQLCSAQLQRLQADAEKIYPNECCGLLLGKLQPHGKILVEVWASANLWSPETAAVFEVDPSLTTAEHYLIAPEDLLAAQRYAGNHQLAIIGVYHSHPEHPAIPSEFDRKFAWPQYSYMIISVRDGTAQDHRSWILDDNHNFQSEELVVAELAKR
jgi:proteasome lid subunit RPN8/RPN11